MELRVKGKQHLNNFLRPYQKTHLEKEEFYLSQAAAKTHKERVLQAFSICFSFSHAASMQLARERY
jgi:hypothetical protein